MKDFISSLFWLAVGVGVCYGGYDLGLGPLNEPGPGFIFFWVGIIMIGLSLGILIKALRTGGKEEKLMLLWAAVNWKKPIYILVGLSLFAHFFLALGFILSSMLLLIFLFRVVERQSWVMAIGGALLSSLAAYLLFQVLLGCQFPAGFLNLG